MADKSWLTQTAELVELQTRFTDRVADLADVAFSYCVSHLPAGILPASRQEVLTFLYTEWGWSPDNRRHRLRSGGLQFSCGQAAVRLAVYDNVDGEIMPRDPFHASGADLIVAASTGLAAAAIRTRGLPITRDMTAIEGTPVTHDVIHVKQPIS